MLAHARSFLSVPAARSAAVFHGSHPRQQYRAAPATLIPPNPPPKHTPGTATLEPPRSIDLKKDRGLTVEWADGATSYYSIAYLRRMSPSAEARDLREQLAKNPLTVLPSSAVSKGPLTALDAELVGNYAIRIHFSDGHSTGIYSWTYLRSIDPANKPEPNA